MDDFKQEINGIDYEFIQCIGKEQKNQILEGKLLAPVYDHWIWVCYDDDSQSVIFDNVCDCQQDAMRDARSKRVPTMEVLYEMREAAMAEERHQRFLRSTYLATGGI